MARLLHLKQSEISESLAQPKAERTVKYFHRGFFTENPLERTKNVDLISALQNPRKTRSSHGT